MSFEKKYDNSLPPREAKRLLTKMYKEETYYRDMMKDRGTPFKQSFIMAFWGILAIVGSIPLLIYGSMHTDSLSTCIGFAVFFWVIGGFMLLIAYLNIYPTGKEGRQFLEDFYADEETAECRTRKKAALWLWAFTRARYWRWTHGSPSLWDRAKDKNDYELSYLLKWL